jgi:hypothetical protein
MRGWRLVIGAMRDDGANDRILDELEGCTLCLRGMVLALASMTGEFYAGMASGNKGLALAVAEKQLAKAIDDARREI